MTAARIGHGATIGWANGTSPETYTTVAEVVNITGPGFSTDALDATNMGSAGGWREKIPGLKDPGEIELECNWLPGNATQDASTGVLEKYNGRDVDTWRLVIPTSPTTTWSALAFVSAFDPEVPVDGKMMASITLTLTGQPTLA